MNNLEWMLQSDPAVATMVQRHLLNKKVPDATEGWIGRLYSLYVPAAHGWAKGVYSHKWVSDHYTLLELLELEANGHDPRFVACITQLIGRMWHLEEEKKQRRGFDVCVAPMLLKMACYADIQDPRMNAIVDYLLKRTMSDGGWNCSWDALPERAHKSSLHTTLSVLEAIAMYYKHGYRYRLDELRVCVPDAEEFILKKHLFRSVHDGEIINPRMIEMHFPVRWFYDAYRALLYFAETGHPYDPRMQETLDRLKASLAKGKLPKGSTHTGAQHFKIETDVYRAMNTYRALRILKTYEPKTYQEFMQK